jgi:hypothetical protein
MFMIPHFITSRLRHFATSPLRHFVAAMVAVYELGNGDKHNLIVPSDAT